MMTVTLRNATAADYAALYGRPPVGRTRAIVGDIDGRLVGIGGYSLAGSHAVAFCDVRPEGRRYRKAIHRAALSIVGEARAMGVTLYAAADPTKPGATRWLERLGFVPAQVDGTGRQLYMMGATDG